jgi:DNA-binding IclR family transcriptional regulator
MKTTKSPKEYKVHSLERGLDLIELLAEDSTEKSLSELSKKASFNQSTTHRVISALKSRGYVRQNPSNSKYRLTLKLFELGNKIMKRFNIKEAAEPILKELAKKTQESIYLIIRDGDDALCVDRIDGNPFFRILSLEIGGRQPLHLGAAPKVLLAFTDEYEIDRIIEEKGLEAWTAHTITNPIKLKDELNKIRKQGYAFSASDVTEGVAAIGFPIFNSESNVIAAISTAGMKDSFTEERINEVIEMLKNASAQMSSRLFGEN